MHSFKRKRVIHNVIFSYGTIAVLCGLVVLTGASVINRYKVEREMAARRADAEAELQQLQQRAAALEAKVDYLEDTRGVEAEIRNRFDVAKEGEQVVVLVNDDKDQPDVIPLDASSSNSNQEKTPWYVFWR